MKPSLLAAVTVLLLFSSCGQKDPQDAAFPPTGGEVGELSPSITLSTLDNAGVALDSYRGEILVLAVWSEICAECLGIEGDMDRIEELHHRYDLQSSGVTVLAPNFIDPLWRISQLRDENGYRMTILHDPEQVFAQAFEIDELPAVLVFVLDGSGIIRYRHQGVDPDEIAGVIDEIRG